MACDDRQLTQAQLEAGFQNQRTGVQKAIRPFSGEATPESLADYLNKEVFPVLQQARAKLNEVFLQVADNAPSGNPLAFYFSDETANADPTAGRIRLDAATQNTATTMRVSQENGRLVDVAPWLDVMAGGVTSPLGTITLFDSINPSRFIRWDLDTMTDQGAYWDLGITVIESSHANPFVDGEGVVISYIPGVSAAGSTVPVTSLGDLAGLSVLGRAGNTSGPMAAITATTADHVARVNAAGTALEWGQATTGSYADDSVTFPKFQNIGGRSIVCKPTTGTGDADQLTIPSNGMLIRAGAGDLSTVQMVANSIIGRLGSGNIVNIASSAANQIFLRGSGALLFEQINDDSCLARYGSGTLASLTFSSLAQAGLVYTSGSGFSVGAGANVTVTADAVNVDDFPLTALADQADDTFLANISGGAAPPTAVALTTLAGAGLTGGANAVLAVGAGTGITVNANDVAVDQAASFTWTGSHEFSGLVRLTEVLTQDLPANTDNLAIGNATVVRLTTAILAGATLTGMVPVGDGHMVYLSNVDTGQTVTLMHDVTSTAANRFQLPSALDYVLTIGAGVWVRYDGTLARWTLATGPRGMSIGLSPTTSLGRTSLSFVEGAGMDLTLTSGSALTAELTIAALSASDTVAGILEIATQSEQETGTDTTRAVTPGRQQFHPSACKAWANAVPGGTLQGGYNVTSVVDTAAGRVVITIATDFSNVVDRAEIATSRQTNSAMGTDPLICTIINNSLATGTSEVCSKLRSTGADTDPTSWYWAAFGDQ